MGHPEAARIEPPPIPPAEGVVPAPTPHPLAETVTRVSLLSASLLLAFMLGLEVVGSLGFFVGVTIGPLHLPVAAVWAMVAGAFVARTLFGKRKGFAVLAGVAVAEIASSSRPWRSRAPSSTSRTTARRTSRRGSSSSRRDGTRSGARTPASARTSCGSRTTRRGRGCRKRRSIASPAASSRARRSTCCSIVTAFAMALALLLTVMPRAPGSAVLLAAVVALNPVAVAQATSFYVDGMSASLLTVILTSVCLLLSRRHGDWVPLAILAAATVILVNVKATGLAYALVLLLGSVLFLLLGQTRLPSRTVLTVVALSVFVGAAVVGFNPYVTNTIDHGTPLYPLTGSIDIMTPNTPGNLVGRDRFTKLALSLFAKSQNAYGKVELETKWPFQLSKDEIEVFQAPDVRASGFGPLFGAGVVLTVLVAALSRLARNKDGEDPAGGQAMVLGVMIAVSVLATAEGWWARYAPQLWLLPVIVAVLAIRVHGRRLAGFAARALCLLLAVDIALVMFGSVSYKVESTAKLREELGRLAAGPACACTSRPSSRTGPAERGRGPLQHRGHGPARGRQAGPVLRGGHLPRGVTGARSREGGEDGHPRRTRARAPGGAERLHPAADGRRGAAAGWLQLRAPYSLSASGGRSRSWRCCSSSRWSSTRCRQRTM